MQPAPFPPQHPGPPPKSSKFPVWLIIVMAIAVIAVLSVGVLAALGIYGTRRYLAAAKTSEAKSSIAMIARGARTAFERERTGESRHALCASATDVPTSIPKGTKYMPASGANLDFDTGDDANGWRCLRFTINQPIYYQYTYRANGGYTAPNAGAPAGSGFEAAAHGDLDGDGEPSVFAMVGVVRGDDVHLNSQIYIENEVE